MKLIKGNKLNANQRAQVTAAFIYRWTYDNPKRELAYRAIGIKPSMLPVSDETWLAEHAFWFSNDGSRLATTRKFAQRLASLLNHPS